MLTDMGAILGTLATPADARVCTRRFRRGQFERWLRETL